MNLHEIEILRVVYNLNDESVNESLNGLITEEEKRNTVRSTSTILYLLYKLVNNEENKRVFLGNTKLQKAMFTDLLKELFRIKTYQEILEMLDTYKLSDLEVLAQRANCAYSANSIAFVDPTDKESITRMEKKETTIQRKDDTASLAYQKILDKFHSSK